MCAYVYIKKEDQPVFVPDEKYEVIATAFENFVTKRINTLLRLPNRDVPASEILKIAHQKEDKGAEIELTNEQASRFQDAELSKFLVDGKLTFRNELEFLKSKGVISFKIRENTPGKSLSDFDIMVSRLKINEYPKWSGLVRQWKEWRSRVEYAKTAELEELKEGTGVVAEAMKKNAEPIQSTLN